MPVAPSHFQLQPADARQRPGPSPPRYIKRQIYSDPNVFRHVDDHAINEARTNYRSFKDLLWNLVYSKNYNDIEKVRAVFRWMTTKNMYTIMFDSEVPGSPEQIIGSFKDGKTTYARIFECLCSYAGLHCITISGWAKGVDYRPGTPITNGAINHSWNAVMIDGNWQLVDSHWATRYLQSERNTPENLVYEYDDFYFIPEPDNLIYSHCPEEPAWQLLYPVRTRADFEAYPLVKSFFFTVGMEFLKQNQGVLYTKRGILVLTLAYTKPSAFTFKLTFGDSQLDTFRGIQLKRYVIQETAKNCVSFYFRSPQEGNYYLTVFAQRVSDRVRVENVYKAACEFKIVCDQAAGDIHPYPLCSDSNWGPGAPVRQYGLIPSHDNAILAAPNGRTEISFATTRDVRLFAKLTKEGVDETTLERAVDIREQENRVYITIQLPARGEYGLEVYANEPSREGDTFTHVCQYLTSYIDRDLGTAYGQPQAFDRQQLKANQNLGPMSYQGPEGQYSSFPGDPNRKMMYPSGGASGEPERQSYETSSRDWDGNTFRAQTYKEERENLTDASRSYHQQTTKLSQRMETVMIRGPDGKLVPAPASDRGRSSPYGQNVYNPNEFPPPPPDMLQQGQGPYQEGQPGSLYSRSSPSYYSRPAYGPAPPGYDEIRRSPFNGTPLEPRSPYVESYSVGASPRGSKLVTGPMDTSRQGIIAGSRVPSGQGPYGGDYHSQGMDPTMRYVPVQQGQQPQGTKKQMVIPVQHATSQPDVSAYHPQRPTEPEVEYQPHPQKLYTSTITIEPPTTFHPVPINKQQPVPKPAPPVVPPKPFKDTQIFQNVDTHAVEVSREEHKTFNDLVWHLIFARQITNELEKARAIFLWLCSADLTGLNFNNVVRGSPEEILMSLKQGTTTYAVVFETLCSYAGLHCKTISGFAKGAEYKPGMKFTGTQGQHSWNAVFIDPAWRLVDCHWAARRLVGKKVAAENVRYELDEYYFMPDPHQLIFTHFPEEPGWQLLERPITLVDFENLVPVKSAFFKYGLQILSHRDAVIRTNREITVRIGCPPDKVGTLAFTFTLAFEDGREEHKGIKLSRYGMQEMVGNVSFFTLRPPVKGAYRLIIYAKDLDKASAEGVYGGVCEYELILDSEPQTPPVPFPPCVHTGWGSGDVANKYGLKPLQQGAIFRTVNGQAEVRFLIPRELRFTAKLKSDDKDEKALAGFIMHRVVGKVAVFTMTAPNRGEFGLEIYCNDPEVDGNSLYHAYQYLIICPETKGLVEPLPLLPPGYLGPQPSMKKLGLSTASHEDPYIQTDEGDMQIALSKQQPLRMTAQLHFVTSKKTEECSEYILQQGRGDLVVFQLRLPKIGMYKFQVFALPYSDTSETLPGVYNYLINCHQTQSSLAPFPQQYAQWKEGCYLHEPLDGLLSSKRPSKGSASSYQNVFFRLDVPKASAVAIVVGEDDWTQLKATGTTWEGEVKMEKYWGNKHRATVCANYGETKSSYSTLLEYKM